MDLGSQAIADDLVTSTSYYPLSNCFPLPLPAPPPLYPREGRVWPPLSQCCEQRVGREHQWTCTASPVSFERSCRLLLQEDTTSSHVDEFVCKEEHRRVKTKHQVFLTTGKILPPGLLLLGGLLFWRHFGVSVLTIWENEVMEVGKYLECTLIAWGEMGTIWVPNEC